MTQHEYYKIKGYISLLQSFTPNGRYNHAKANKLTALLLKLELDVPLSKPYEEEIKQLVRNLLYSIETPEKSLYK